MSKKTMNCESYILLLDEYLNNELEDEVRSSVLTHLAACESCREEIRFLESESVFYREIEAYSENNFTNQWKAMHERMVAESIVKNDVSPNRSEAENHFKLPLSSMFFVQLENLFFTNKAAFGILILIIFGFAGVFLLTSNNSAEDEPLVASSESEEVFKPETVLNLPQVDDASQPEKPDERDEPKFIKKLDSGEKTAQKPRAINGKKKNDLTAAGNKNEKLRLVVNPAENKANANSSYAYTRLPVEKTDSDAQTMTDDGRLASHLNKVHLFLLMIRNLQNARTINTVLGDKYQTEAGMFLEKNINYKKQLLRNKNIPAAELLGEIEPVLRAISNLNSRNEKIDAVSASGKQTGVIFRMRLWLSNAKAENEKSL